jgi:thioredoxin 1
LKTTGAIGLDFSIETDYYRTTEIINQFIGGKMANIPEVSGDTFQEEVLSAEKPVLVDFSAVWCGPCKMLDPIVEQLANEWSGQIKVVKLDVDDNPNIAMQYQVMGVPTLMLFIDGETRERLTGYQPKDRITSKIKPHLQTA